MSGLPPPDYTVNEDGERVIAASRRPDGTVRKERRVRAGYVPQDEQAVYVSRGAMMRQNVPKCPGFEESAEPAKPKSKSAAKNAKRKEKRLTEQAGAAPAGGSSSGGAAGAGDAAAAAVQKLSLGGGGGGAAAAAAAAAPAAEEPPSVEKQIRNLKKKMRQAEALVEKRAGAARRLPLAPPRGKSTAVDLGGEPHEVIESLAASDDILHHFTTHFMHSAHETRSKKLADLMQTNLVTAGPEDKLSDVEAKMKSIEGVPVVNAGGKLVGVLSKKDFKKGGTLVKDVMSSNPIACKATEKATAAAHVMIDHKFHRVPIVDDAGVCVGIVTRTDVFWALASDNDRSAFFHEHGIDL
ncbi:partner of Y14 and mago-like [Chlorella sorokiniana]|uniref:Partner of Y14 and mago-like n=1 Tax=Chlorella sorokiniana TaxID=3076 RepID=A0A2P6TM84_CHLSO|nr:partner of Y14 and mago-like [Chlorella sorokiniana]|eukprot:PRW45446.1 partner of Y14 and mago-like [Chlorella sorokiniana]